MPKIRLSKTEQKQQQDALARYNRFLPTLKLKKQQLQLELREFRRRYDECRDRQQELKHRIDEFAVLFDDPRAAGELNGLLHLDSVTSGEENIAGVAIPVFVAANFTTAEYDLFATPLWYDDALEALRQTVSLREELKILEECCRRLDRELRTTSQRVNLFEKVMIPECKANLRTIRIYLGDQDTASVIRSKIAKKKSAEVSA